MLIRSMCLLLWSLYRDGQSGVDIENKNSEIRQSSSSHHPFYQYTHINRYSDDFCHSGLVTLLSYTKPGDFAQDSSPLTFSWALLYLLSCYFLSFLFLLLYRINLMSMQTSSRITILKQYLLPPYCPPGTNCLISLSSFMVWCLQSVLYLIFPLSFNVSLFFTPVRLCHIDFSATMTSM